MKGPITVAIATGALAAIAFGGIAMAAEAEDPGVTLVAAQAADAPDESDGEATEIVSPSGDVDDEQSGDAQKGGGLVCVLVPIEAVEVTEDSDATGTEPTTEETPSIDELLAANDIECSGTGNERSSEVALVPRYLAHSDAYTGAEKGRAISLWAKTKANQKSDDGGESEIPQEGESTADVDQPSSPASPGKSGEAHGPKSGSQPGKGHGR